MSIIINRKNTLTLLLYVFVFICVFFPLDPYNLKFVVLAIIALFAFGDYSGDITSGRHAYYYLMGLLFPFLLMIVSILNNGQIIQGISGAYPAVLILLLIPIVKRQIDYEKILCNVLLLEVIITILIVLLDIAHIYDVNSTSGFRMWFYDMGMGYMGKSYAYSSFYRVFFKSSPLFIYLLDYCWNNKKKVLVVLTAIALFFSGTRANVIATMAYIGWRLIFNTTKKRNNQIILSILMVIILFFAMGGISGFIKDMMNRSGSIASDVVRSGQLKGLIESLKNPSTLLFGDGFGTQFYDYGRMQYISGVEYSYIDLLRQIGIVFFVPFFVFTILPLFKKVPTGLKISHIGYMAIAFTNPLFFTSTAYLAYLFMYYNVEVGIDSSIGESKFENSNDISTNTVLRG